MRPIPTTYRGTQFRSRLEADWARFFDENAVQWAYEAEGFDIGGIWYLPDFWLPECRTFVEVKGIMDAASQRKIDALARAVRRARIMFVVAEAPVGRRFYFADACDELACDEFATFGVCGSCRRGSFHYTNGAWTCQCCDEYNGDGNWTFRVNGDEATGCL